MKKFLILFSLVQLMAEAQTTVVLNPVADNSIYSENNLGSNGAGLNIFVGRTYTGNNRRGLIKFDLSAIPANAIVTSSSLSLATLRSANNTLQSHNIAVHRLNTAWGEGTSNTLGNPGNNATTNDATWQYSKYSAASWITAGGDFVSTATASAGAILNDYVVFNNLSTDINFWRTNPIANFGWIMIGEENVGGSAKGFGSRENEIFKPELSVTYQVPVPKYLIVNEVNPTKQWIEVVNTGTTSIELNTCWLASGANIAQIGTGGASLLAGNATLGVGEYAVLSWSNLTNTNNEVAVYEADPTNPSTIMLDYLQYGLGNQANAVRAVQNQVWENAGTALNNLSLGTESFALNPTQTYANGTASLASLYLSQRQTPNLPNNLCPNSLMLNGNLIDATYKATNTIGLTVNANNTSRLNFEAGKSVTLSPNTNFSNGAVVKVEIKGCN